MSSRLYPPVSAHRDFDSLEATAFQQPEHAASLKGLLKDKEAQPTFAGECEAIRDALIQRAQRLVAQSAVYLVSRLSAVLAPDNGGWHCVPALAQRGSLVHVCPGNLETATCYSDSSFAARASCCWSKRRRLRE
jgi:hypothetical protein